jgi:hypothetical protein
MIACGMVTLMIAEEMVDKVNGAGSLQIKRNDLRTCARELARNVPTDSTSRSGYNCSFAVKLKDQIEFNQIQFL